MPNSVPVLEFRDVTKTYRSRRGAVHALNGMSFRLNAGAIHVLLGPNGAGKTTSLEMAVGLRRPDSGSVRTLGLDPLARGAELQQRVSLQPQEVTVFEYLRVGEILDMWASLYDNPHPREEILASLDLANLTDRQITKLSGGQKQRLNVALAMVSKPDLLILDEPSTGLDPRARETLWDTLKTWRDQGTTIVLSTHSMEEAHALADAVMIIGGGTCIDQGTPAELLERHAEAPAVTFRAIRPILGEIRAELNALGTLPMNDDEAGAVRTHDTDRALTILAGTGAVVDLRVDHPTLADAYKTATGTELAATMIGAQS
ncbi:MAG: ABC transporter ATP-binding protein [Ancrocorticia sp.]